MKRKFETAINVEIDWVNISQTSDYDPWWCFEYFAFIFLKTSLTFPKNLRLCPGSSSPLLKFQWVIFGWFNFAVAQFAMAQLLSAQLPGCSIYGRLFLKGSLSRLFNFGWDNFRWLNFAAEKKFKATHVRPSIQGDHLQLSFIIYFWRAFKNKKIP